MTDDKRYYRTEIPNIIDDLGLDPHERALYVHYKRACGGNDCEWVESVRITAQRTKMSVGRASQARNSLVERGLIRLVSKGNDGTAVRIVNIWELNTIFYSQEYRPDVDGWSVEQLKEWCLGVHNMNTIKEEGSYYEHLEPVLEPGVHNANTSVHNMNAGVHNMNNKKEPIKKEHGELLPKGNGDKSPPADLPPLQAEKDPEPGPKTVVKDKFLELTNLAMPSRKPDQNFWWSQFSEILNVSNKDPARAISVMTEVVGYMQSQHLAITGPQSIVNLCRSVMAGQKLNGANQNGRPKNQTSISGLRGENSQIERRADPKTGRTYYWDRKRKCEVPGPAG